jgi:hypothetical protein
MLPQKCPMYGKGAAILANRMMWRPGNKPSSKQVREGISALPSLSPRDKPNAPDEVDGRIRQSQNERLDRPETVSRVNSGLG